MAKSKLINFDILKTSIENLKLVNIEDEFGEISEFKFINIENLSFNAWKKRFKKELSPKFEYKQHEKYGKTFLSLQVYQCIEIETVVNDVVISDNNSIKD